MKPENIVLKEKSEHLLLSLYDILPYTVFNDAMDLINHSEYGVALELLCVQLYEYDITISNNIKSVIIDLVIDMGLNIELINGIKINN